MRRQHQHPRSFEFVGVAAVALLGKLRGGSAIARALMNLQMQRIGIAEPPQRAIDSSNHRESRGFTLYSDRVLRAMKGVGYTVDRSYTRVLGESAIRYYSGD